MADNVTLTLFAITLLLAGYALYRSYQTTGTVDFRPGAVLSAIQDARPKALQVMEILQIAVNAAEQLKREHKINSNDEALNHALDLAKQWIPDEWEVSNTDIIEGINAAVLVSSALSKQAGVSSENATNTYP